MKTQDTVLTIKQIMRELIKNSKSEYKSPFEKIAYLIRDHLNIIFTM